MCAVKATFLQNKVFKGVTYLDSIDPTGLAPGKTGHPAGPDLKKKGKRGESFKKTKGVWGSDPPEAGL